MFTPYFESQVEKSIADPSFFRTSLINQLRNIAESNLKVNSFLDSVVTLETLENIFPHIVSIKAKKPLFGLSFAVKDNFQIKNLALTWGQKEPVIAKSLEHAPLVQSLIDAGASLLGSTNLDPVALGMLGNNPHFGKVINPRYQERISGGSSSGSAAAVASGMCDFAIGSDLRGSIRIPAACCGVSSFKPSRSIFTNAGSMLLSSLFDSPGLLAQFISDILFIYNQINLPKTNFKEIEILIPPAEELGCLEENIRIEFNQYLEKISRFFLLKESPTSIGLQKALDLSKALIAMEAENFTNSTYLPLIPDALAALTKFAQGISAVEREEFREKHNMLQDEIYNLLNSNRLILCPTIPCHPPCWKNIGHHKEQEQLKTFNYFMPLANLCGLPAVSFPLKSWGSQFPLSLQLMAGPNLDQALLGVAAKIQASLYEIQN